MPEAEGSLSAIASTSDMTMLLARILFLDVLRGPSCSYAINNAWVGVVFVKYQSSGVSSV